MPDTGTKLHVVTGFDPELVLRFAARDFLVPQRATRADPFPTVRYLLALRQGGLRDDVLRMAAEAAVAGWFDPPLCLFAELPARLGAPERRTASDIERLVLVEHALRDGEGGALARVARPDQYVDAVDRLFGELIAEGVPPAMFDAALGSRPDRDAFEIARDGDLARAYAAYHDALTRAGLGDGRDALVWCARAIADDARRGGEELAEALGGRREIRLVGLQDLRGGWRALLAALVASPAIARVALYGTAAPALDPLHATTERLDDGGGAAGLLFDGAGRRSGEATLVVAPDVDREVDEVARRVRALVDAGTRPERIAVVARQARPQVDRVLDALRRLRVPATARRRVGLREVPVLRAFRALLAAADDGWTRRGLVELAEQPYIDTGLPAAVVDHIGYRRPVRGLEPWRIALADLEARARRREEPGGSEREEDREPTPPWREVAAAGAAFHAFAARARALDAHRPLREWLHWLGDFLDRDPWHLLRRVRRVPNGSFEIVRLDLAGWTGLCDIVRQWSGALDAAATDGGVIDAGELARRLDVFLSADVALWTTTRRGVQVIEALAAAQRSFDHVFLVGMEAGAFPRAAPRSPIFDDGDRAALMAAALPLEPREVWDRRERELFRALVAGARRGLTMSFARLDERGREVIRSAFVEELAAVATLTEVELAAFEVVIPGTPLYEGVDAADHAHHAARVERERALKVPGPYTGSIGDPELLSWLAVEFGDQRVWSPTQLEEYARCPWAYFSKRLLHVERLDDPAPDMEPTVRGSVLHDAMRRFYDGARTRLGGPVFLRREDEAWATGAVEAAVDDALNDAAARGWVGHPALMPAMREELRRIARGFLLWEIGWHEEMFAPRKINAPATIRTGVVEHELRFAQGMLERDGIALRYRGTIDRVEASVDERVPTGRWVAAADYKTSMGATPGGGHKSAWGDGVVLQLPLYAHALAALYPEHTVSRTAYLVLRSPAQVHELQPWRYDRKQGNVQESAADRERLEAALHAAVAHVRRARAGEFPADPPPSCGCPPWCHGRDICRVAGGPREARRR